MKKTMKTWNLLYSAIVFLGVTEAPHASMAEPETKWLKHTLKVCWGNQSHLRYSLLEYVNQYSFGEKFDQPISFDDQQKSIIRAIISQEYRKDRTGIEFVGWEDCVADTGDADIVIFQKQDASTGSLAGQGLIGNGVVDFRVILNEQTGAETLKTDYVRNRTGLKSFVLINTSAGSRFSKVNADDFLRIVSLHEFGHVAGLRHEHARLKDAKKDSSCKNFEVQLGEKEMEKTALYGPYDPNSIMSYCYLYGITKFTGLKFEAKNLKKPMLLQDPTIFDIFAIAGSSKKEIILKIALSSGDLHTLNCLYPKSGIASPEACKNP
jgi:hypothetical protein